MHMNRAWSTLQLKAVDDGGGKRKFTGVASTIQTDRVGDVVLPKGAKFKLPFPLLSQHNAKEPIGWVRAVRTNDKQIEVDCEIHDEPTPGKLKDRLDETWQMIKAGLVAGLSIGFNPLKSARIDGTYGYEIQEWDWLELSAVTIPANAQCSITAIKSIDQEQRAALGLPDDRDRPGASGQKQVASGRPSSTRSQKGNTVKTLKELMEARAQKMARMGELIELFKSDGHEASDEENAEFDSLDTDVKSLDLDIKMARFHERNAAGATPVEGKSAEAAARSRGGMGFVKKEDPEDKFKGQSFTRYLIAKAVAFEEIKKGNFVTPGQVAEHRWGRTHPKLVAAIKANVAGGGTGSGEWGAELAQSDTRYRGDFIEFLYSKTVFDRLPLREVPARIHVKGQDGAATGYWVGESKAIPVSKPDFSDVELTPLKVGAIAVASKELLADSSPASEGLIRDSITEASAQRVDTTFLSASAAVSGVSPAGMLNGVSGIAASGTDAAAVRADLQSLLYPFVTAKMASGIWLVTNPATGLALSMLVNALGQAEFPNINENGGTLGGRNVLTGDNVTPGNVIALRPQDIWKIADTGIDISMSDTATIEQSDDPTGASDTPADMSSPRVSMFQTESVAFKVVRRINFAKRRTGAVQFIQDAEYGGVVS